MKEKLLLVEDENDLGNVVKQYLEVMDFEVDWCKTGRTALEHFKKHAPSFQLVIIDIRLPEMDGFELAEHIVEFNGDIPFLFLTARNEKKDKLYGLKIGADDYITKPFDIDELVLRIRNIIRRKRGTPANTNSSHIISLGDVVYNIDSQQLCIGEAEPVTLTARESELLAFLLRHPDKVLRREDILTQLWGENDYFLGRSLDVFISRLRKQLAASEHLQINNIYGVGFIVTHKNTTGK